MKWELGITPITAFVFQNERLSGIVFDAKNESTKRHLAIADAVMAKPARYVSAQLINAGLTGRREKWLREGTPGGQRRVLPPGEDMRKLIRKFDARVIRGLRFFARNKRSDAEKVEFAWKLHDYLVCVQAFKEGNERTARLVLNHVRVLLGLPIFIIPYGDDKYFENLERYRTRTFIPELEKLAA